MTKDNEFTLVVRSKGKRSRVSKLPNLALLNICGTSLDTSYDTDKTIQKITDNIKLIENSSLFGKLIENLTELREKQIQIVCFGLGSLESYISKFQLALGVLLHRYLEAETSLYFDPCFSEQDSTVLRHFNCDVLSENLEGKYEAQVSNPNYVTLFYLPHCPKQLTNNLLWKNWSEAQLSQSILIANSFESTLERSTSKVIESNAGLISKIAPYVTQYSLPEFEPVFEAFNDLSLIKFDRLKEIAVEDFWIKPVEPVYSAEDLEFVLNTNNGN